MMRTRGFLTTVLLTASMACRALDGEILEVSLLSDANAIQLDGSLADWRLVVGDPTLTIFDFWGDPGEGDGAVEGPYDLRLDVWIAIVPPDQVLFAFKRRDNRVSLRPYDIWQDGQFELTVDAGRSGGAFAEDVGVQRVVVMAFAEGEPSYTGAAGEAANGTDNIDGVVVTDTLSDDVLLTRAEVRFTMFDPQGGRVNLAVGDTVGVGMVATDVDSGGRNVYVQVITWPGGISARELQKDAAGLGTAVLVGPVSTQASPGTWGKLKRGLRSVAEE